MSGQLPMNKNTILLGGLLESALAIVLFETGKLKLARNIFHAQTEMNALVLENKGQRVIIKVGSHIMVTNKFNQESFISGTLVGIEIGVILLIKNLFT